MTTDIKHQVLFAIYAEYQKDIPDMEKITYRLLEMDSQAFTVALMKLQNEGYIQGVIWTPPDTMSIKKIRALRKDNLFMTRRGVEYVEKQAEIEESMSATEKIKALAKQAGLFGLTVLQQAIISRIAG